MTDIKRENVKEQDVNDLEQVNGGSSLDEEIVVVPITNLPDTTLIKNEPVFRNFPELG